MRVALRYGCNPHQGEATFETSADAPAVRVRAGSPSFVNMLDALNAWQLVRELKEALGLPAAASFKHVSPVGAAVAVALSDDLRRAYEVGDRELTPLATAYARARGADPKSAFGDFAAFSDAVDVPTARHLRGVVSDGVIAPGFEPGAFDILAAKKGGAFLLLEANADYAPPRLERRQVFGVTLTQARNDRALGVADLGDMACGALTDAARRDLLVGLVTVKYTQSNAVGLALDGQMIGVGAGQQSRVDCTKLAAAKASLWHLGRHPEVLAIRFRPGVQRQARINWRIRYLEGDLTAAEQSAFAAATESPPAPLALAEREAWLARQDGLALVSDGFIPFRDNVDHAAKHGVRFIAQPGGSVRDAEVEAACREHGIAMARTGVRLFHH